MTGEVRRVNRIEQRINEAAKLGFTKIYVPKNSLTGITTPSGIQVVDVSTLAEVLKKVFLIVEKRLDKTVQSLMFDRNNYKTQWLIAQALL